MVQDARIRGQSKGSATQSRAITEDVEGENARPYESQPAGADNYNFVRNNKAAYATAGNDDDTMKKLRKLEVLAQADKETIESQQKKMHALRAEMEQLKQKYGQLKRNYDSVSLHAKKDAAANQKILDMKQAYEKEIDELK